CADSAAGQRARYAWYTRRSFRPGIGEMPPGAPCPYGSSPPSSHADAWPPTCVQGQPAGASKRLRTPYGAVDHGVDGRVKRGDLRFMEREAETVNVQRCDATAYNAFDQGLPGVSAHALWGMGQIGTGDLHLAVCASRGGTLLYTSGVTC